MSYKGFLLAMIRGENNGEIAEDLAEEIQALPDGRFVLHGDYHPGNVMITADGEVVIIDLLNVCSGPREYDVARTFFLLENEKWQDRYLREMGYGREDIEGYLKVIRKARKYERCKMIEAGKFSPEEVALYSSLTLEQVLELEQELQPV